MATTRRKQWCKRDIIVVIEPMMKDGKASEILFRSQKHLVSEQSLAQCGVPSSSMLQTT